MFNDGGYTIFGNSATDGPATCPALMIGGGWNGMSRRGSTQNISNHTLVETLDSMVHTPTIFWTPMPIQYSVSVSIEIPVDTSPYFVRFCSNCLLVLTTIFIIFADGNQCLSDEGTLHDIAPIIVFTESF